VIEKRKEQAEQAMMGQASHFLSARLLLVHVPPALQVIEKREEQAEQAMTKSAHEVSPRFLLLNLRLLCSASQVIEKRKEQAEQAMMEAEREEERKRVAAAREQEMLEERRRREEAARREKERLERELEEQEMEEARQLLEQTRRKGKPGALVSLVNRGRVLTACACMQLWGKNVWFRILPVVRQIVFGCWWV
jgi:hypothetical protein